MKSRLLSTVCAVLFTFTTLPINAAFLGRLPATPSGTDYQAYYDDQLNITWAADANINGLANWHNQRAWAAGLSLGGITGWRLPSMDVNGDGTVLGCHNPLPAGIEDNEHCYMHQISGVTSSTPGPFSNIQPWRYWSGTENILNPAHAWSFDFKGVVWGQGQNNKDNFEYHAWAVRDGDVDVVPVPGAVWLFGSGLLGLIGVAKKRKAT